MDVNKISCVFHKSVKFDSSKNEANKTNNTSFEEVLKTEQENIEKYAIPNEEKDNPPMLKYAVPPYYRINPPVAKYAVPPIYTKIEEKDLPPAPMYAIPDENETK